MLPSLLGSSGETHGDWRIGPKTKFIVHGHSVVKALNDLWDGHCETGTWLALLLPIRPNPRWCFAVVNTADLAILVDEKGSRIPPDFEVALDGSAVCRSTAQYDIFLGDAPRNENEVPMLVEAVSVLPVKPVLGCRSSSPSGPTQDVAFP